MWREEVILNSEPELQEEVQEKGDLRTRINKLKKKYNCYGIKFEFYNLRIFYSFSECENKKVLQYLTHKIKMMEWDAPSDPFGLMKK